MVSILSIAEVPDPGFSILQGSHQLQHQSGHLGGRCSLHHHHLLPAAALADPHGHLQLLHPGGGEAAHPGLTWVWCLVQTASPGGIKTIPDTRHDGKLL